MSDVSDRPWWGDVFTERELVALQTKVDAILEEFGEEDVEPIMVVVPYSPAEFAAAMETAYYADIAGFNMEAIGTALSQQYFEEPSIIGTEELNTYATRFFKMWMEDEDDEDEEADDED